MTAPLLLQLGILPALRLLPSQMDTAPARAMLVAIALQESRCAHRRQVSGPARGYFQFELAGGCAGVLTHRASKPHAERICDLLDIPPAASAVYTAIEFHDVLAAVFARLLLWTDPKILAGPDRPDAAWDTYYRTWRPGKPHPETWAAHYATAWALVATPSRLDVSGAEIVGP